MDLDELRSTWAQRDRMLQAALDTQTAALRGIVVDRDVARLRRVRATSVFEMVVYALFLAAFGLYLAANWGRWEFFVPGLLLHVWTIAMGALTFAERAKVRDIDFAAPVLDVQKRLTQLQSERARVFQWAFLTGQILWWIPFFIVVCWGFFGVDLYRLSPFMPQFMAINLAVGVALVPVLLWLSHWLGPRLARSTAGRSLLDSVTGRDLAEARAIAERLARFEAGVA
jgi:MFS family permease